MAAIRLVVVSALLVAFLTQGTPAFTWTSAIKHGANLRRCVGENVTFPWSYVTEYNENVVVQYWFSHKNGAFASLGAGQFKTSHSRAELTGNAGVTLSDICGQDEDTYGVIVRLEAERNMMMQSATLSVLEPPQTIDGHLRIEQQETEAGIKLTCGKFESLGTPPASVLWKDPTGRTLQSTHFSDGVFSLQLSPFSKGGTYTCYLPNTSVTCLPSASPLLVGASVPVKTMENVLRQQAEDLDALKQEVERLKVKNVNNVTETVVSQSQEDAIKNLQSLVNQQTHTIQKQSTQIYSLQKLASDQDTQISVLQNQVSHQNTQISGLNNEVSVLQNLTTDQNTQISGLQNQVLDQNTQISGLQNQVSDQNTQISGLQNQMSNQNTQISGLQKQASDQNTQISGVQKQASDQNTQISGLQNQASDQNTQISVLQNQVSHQNTQISDLNNEVSDLQNLTTDQNTQISDLQKQASDQNTQISSLHNKVSHQNTKISDLNNEVSVLQNLITDQNTQISGLQNQVSDHNTRISGVQNQVSDQNTQIAGLQNQTSEHNTHISVLQNQSSGQNIQISGLQNQVSDQNTQISGLQSHEKTASRLAVLESNVTSLLTSSEATATRVEEIKRQLDQNKLTELRLEMTSLQANVANLESSVGQSRWTVEALQGDMQNVQSRFTKINAVRLVNGSNVMEGRVELWVDDQWGTVCDDDWDTKDAMVVCAMLGYSRTGAVAGTGAQFGEGSGRIVMDDVACSGRETSIFKCNAGVIGTSNCVHTEDASVACQP